MNGREAWQRLRTDPAKFLRDNVLRSNASTPESGVKACRIAPIPDCYGVRRGRVRKKNIHAAGAFFVGPQNVIRRGWPIAVHFVKTDAVLGSDIMANRRDVAKDGTGGYVLPAGGQPALMMTEKLTGCSFCIKKLDNGRLEVCHIQPPGAGDDLQDKLTETNAWDTIYGSRDYDQETGQVTIVGVWRKKRWCFYAQKSTGGAGRDGLGYMLQSFKCIYS